MSQPLTRRETLAGLAATAATGWSARTAQAGSRPNLFSVLQETSWLGNPKWRFLGADGNEVDTGTLARSLRHHYTTSFVSYLGCDQYCPLTLSHMANLSERAQKQGTKLMHIIINAIPEQQGSDPVLRESAISDIELRGLKPFRPGRAMKDSDTIVLFATRDGRESGLDNTLPIAISQALGNITRTDSATDHSSYVNLYAPGGSHIGRASGTAPNVADILSDALHSYTSRGR